MSFVIRKKIREKEKSRSERGIHRRGGSSWKRLQDISRSTHEVLYELADERGLDIKDIYASENIDLELWGNIFDESQKEKVEQNPEAADFLLLSSIYKYWAKECLNQLSETIEENEKNEPLEEALKIIDWYQKLIRIKIQKALYDYHFHSIEISNTAPNYNGSAKMALIGMERSIENWKIIQPLCPAYQKDISHLLVMLEQLRCDTDKFFPKARTFVRPGLDD